MKLGEYIPFNEFVSLAADEDYAFYYVDPNSKNVLFYVELASSEEFDSILFNLFGNPQFTIYIFDWENIYLYDFKRNTLSDASKDEIVNKLIEMAMQPDGFMDPVDFVFEGYEDGVYYYRGQLIDLDSYHDAISSEFFYGLLKNLNLIKKEAENFSGIENVIDFNDGMGGNLVFDDSDPRKSILNEFIKTLDYNSILMVDEESIEALQFNNSIGNDITFGITFSEFGVTEVPPTCREGSYDKKKLNFVKKYLEKFYRFDTAR